MIDLFAAAGYASPTDTMVPLERYDISDKKVKVKSYDIDAQQIVWKPVNALYYKGMSDPSDSFRVERSGKEFYATGDHLIYNTAIGDYQPVRHALGDVSVLTSTGDTEAATITPAQVSFPILDIEVEDTECYYTAGLLSHNSFGGVAKLMSEALRKFNPILEKYKTGLIMISQERENVGSLYGPDYKVTGGRAIKFYASNRSRITRTGYVKEKGIITGIEMRVKNGKNKAGIPYREAELTLMFNGGFDTEKEYMDFIVMLGIVEQKGAYFRSSKYDFNIQGRAKLQDWLNEHPKEYEEIKLQVNQMLCGETILDKGNEAPAEDDIPVRAVSTDVELSDGEVNDDEPPTIDIPED